MSSVNAVVDTVTNKVVTDNIEPVAYGVAGAVVYYLIAPYVAPYVAKIPLLNQIPSEFQPVVVATLVVASGYMLKSKEIMAVGSGMAFAGLFMGLAPKAIEAVSKVRN